MRRDNFVFGNKFKLTSLVLEGAQLKLQDFDEALNSGKIGIDGPHRASVAWRPSVLEWLKVIGMQPLTPKNSTWVWE